MPGYKDFKIEDSKEGSSKTDIEKFTVQLVIPITGVPFLKQSRLAKQVSIDRTQ
jgi:hypothetical protein